MASVVVCLYLEFPGDVWEVFGERLGGVWGYLSDINRNWRHSYMFEGYLGFHSLQYGAVTLFWHSHETRNLFCWTILKHQNIKMYIYKVDKNHWVKGFFCFLVPIRKKL